MEHGPPAGDTGLMRLAALVLAWACLAAAAWPGAASPSAATTSCRPLPAAVGSAIRIGPRDAARLPELVTRAAAGTTILLDPGRYRIARTLVLARERVTLRSATGRAGSVVLDGGYAVGDLVAVAASRVTVADLTLTRSSYHLVHVVPPDGARSIAGTRLHGLRLLDAAQQFVKVNPNAARTAFADGGRVECSLFRLTDRGRPRVSTVLPCYTGGVDAHGARGWAVRLNRFEGIRCAEGLAEHAIHFWTGSRDTLVERNTIVNCARGIGFGLGETTEWARRYADRTTPGYVGHYDGLVRGNVVVATRPGTDTGIGLEQALGARVYHNTVWASPAATGYFSSLDLRFASTRADVRNNLVTRITLRDGGRGRLDRNVESVPAGWFRAPARLDFHLAPAAAGARDRGARLAAAGLDLDGELRDAGAPDLGADEAA
jgi:hypothetical protein